MAELLSLERLPLSVSSHADFLKVRKQSSKIIRHYTRSSGHGLFVADGSRCEPGEVLYTADPAVVGVAQYSHLLCEPCFVCLRPTDRFKWVAAAVCQVEAGAASTALGEHLKVKCPNCLLTCCNSICYERLKQCTWHEAFCGNGTHRMHQTLQWLINQSRACHEFLFMAARFLWEHKLPAFGHSEPFDSAGAGGSRLEQGSDRRIITEGEDRVFVYRAIDEKVQVQYFNRMDDLWNQARELPGTFKLPIRAQRGDFQRLLCTFGKTNVQLRLPDETADQLLRTGGKIQNLKRAVEAFYAQESVKWPEVVFASGYYPLIALLNHNDAPTADLDVGDDLQCTVWSQCSLKGGDEITIRYTTNAESLLHQYGIPSAL